MVRASSLKISLDTMAIKCSLSRYQRGNKALSARYHETLSLAIKAKAISCWRGLYGQSTRFFRNISSNSSTDCQNGDLFSISGFKSGTKLSKHLKNLHSVIPIMVIAWNNASSNPGNKLWSDIWLFCMSTNNIIPRSKSPASYMRLDWSRWYLASFSIIISLLSFTI